MSQAQSWTTQPGIDVSPSSRPWCCPAQATVARTQVMMEAPSWVAALHSMFILINSVDSSDLAFHVTEGSTVILPCHYSVKHHGLTHVCWGRYCGTFWCHDIIIQTDEYGVVSKVSDRYRLIGDVLSGQMDLGIQKIQNADSGPYCCRVDIEGFFNDKKVSYTLKVTKALTTLPPTTTTTTPLVTETTETQTESALTRREDSSLSDTDWPNITYIRSGAMMEEPVSAITQQVNILVLSVSLSLLLLLSGALAFFMFKRGMRGPLKTGCFSKEPRHIIYEIRTRRPVEENIYTLE